MDKKISNIKQLHSDPASNDKHEDKKSQIDLSAISDGVYPLEYVGGAFIKRGNTGITVISLRFMNEELSQMRFDIPIGKVDFGGNIIIPEINPGSINSIIKH